MIFIFLLALILFGPKKLPEIGREIGKFLAEFKRASNDFTHQLQSEIEKVGVDSNVSGAIIDAGVQKASSNFTQTLLPPAVSAVVSEIDTAHERLMQTAKLAFEAQNFTLRPPDAPVIAAAPAIPATAEATEAAAAAAPEAGNTAEPVAEASAQLAPASPASSAHPSPDPAPSAADPATQNG